MRPFKKTKQGSQWLAGLMHVNRGFNPLEIRIKTIVKPKGRRGRQGNIRDPDDLNEEVAAGNIG